MNPYTPVQYKGHWYIKVLTYNNQTWYPWKYKYIVEDTYPTSNITEATKFATQSAALDFIDKIVL